MLEWNWGKPLLESFSNQPQKGYSEITPDAGSPFRRLNFTDIQDLATCNFILNRFDYIRFMSWYKLELRQGTIPFLIWDCRYGVQRVARLVGDVPQYTTNSKYYNLSLTLAFESGVVVYDRDLIINEEDFLIVNDDDVLVVGLELRL